MSKELAESIAKVKADHSDKNKTEFVSELIKSSFFVPVIVEADNESRSITQLGYYSIKSDNGSFLLVFTSVEAIGVWRKDVQFLELNFSDVCSIVNIKGAGYEGILIDNGGNSMGLKKDFLDKVNRHIKIKHS